MRAGKSGIKKRAPKLEAPEMKELRVPIKKKTAENIIKLNDQMSAKYEEYQKSIIDFQNHVLPLLTERGVETGQVVSVTEKPPYELILKVPKK